MTGLSGINWGLVALTGECGTEVVKAGIELASDFGAAEETNLKKSEAITIDKSFNVFQDDAGPVLKVYYEAHPS